MSAQSNATLLKQIREARCISRYELAKSVGLRRMDIVLCERGEFAPDSDIPVRIAAFLGVDAAALY